MEDDNNTASKLIEIKEILDFKENADYKRLSCDEIKVLRDYITNLQEELETRQYDINNLTYQLAKEKEENAELKEYLKTMEKGKDNNLNRFLNYKSRIEKAIPMLKELNIKLKGILNTGIDIKEISDIEDTLNGRSDE